MLFTGIFGLLKLEGGQVISIEVIILYLEDSSIVLWCEIF